MDLIAGTNCLSLSTFDTKHFAFIDNTFNLYVWDDKKMQHAWGEIKDAIGVQLALFGLLRVCDRTSSCRARMGVSPSQS